MLRWHQVREPVGFRLGWVTDGKRNVHRQIVKDTKWLSASFQQIIS